MTLEGEEKVAVVSPQATSLEVQELKDQIARLTEQVAALATQKDSGGPSHSRFTTPQGRQVCYYYRRYVKDFDDIAAPLIQLTQK